MSFVRGSLTDDRAAEVLRDALWQPVRRVLLSYGTAVSTMALAAFPAAYTIDPGLANRHGFWRDQRWLLFVIWLIAVFIVVQRLTETRDRDGGRQATLIEQIGKAQGDTAQLMSGLIEAASATKAGIHDVAEAVLLRSIQERTGRILEAAGGPIGGIGDLPALPPDTIFIVAVGRDLRRAHILHPLDLVVSADQPSFQALINSAVREQDERAAVIRFDEQHSARLPRQLRLTKAAIVAPILNDAVEMIGVLIACSSSEIFFGPAVRRGLLKRIVNMSEQLAPAASLWINKLAAEEAERV
jgi:hypothetical protein